MILSTKSSVLALFMNFKIDHILNPWVIEVNFEEETITIEKRNWHLIGKDSDTLAFRFIRKITVNEHLFGADVYIKAIGGSVSGKYFPKRKIKAIKQELIEYNKTKRQHIIFS
jgi:hypothetical protein